MSLPAEIKSLVREYVSPTIWARDGTMTICTKHSLESQLVVGTKHSLESQPVVGTINDIKRKEVYKRQRLLVTPGLWGVMWSPLTVRKRLYRCLIIYLIDKGKGFDLNLLPSTLRFTVDPYVTGMSFFDKLILNSSETTHDINLEAPPEEVKRLGIYTTQIGAIHADSSTAAKVIVIPIGYDYKALERIKESLVPLHKDPSFLKKEVKKLTSDARINNGNVVSITVRNPSLYVEGGGDFDRIYVSKGLITFKKGKKEVYPRGDVTPLLRNISDLEATGHAFNVGFYLSQEVQEAIERAVMDPRFFVEKKITFTPDLRYSIKDLPPPRSAYTIFIRTSRVVAQKEHPELDSTAIDKLLESEWQRMDAGEKWLYLYLHEHEKNDYLASLAYR